jgi:hypothetical protein
VARKGRVSADAVAEEGAAAVEVRERAAHEVVDLGERLAGSEERDESSVDVDDLRCGCGRSFDVAFCEQGHGKR